MTLPMDVLPEYGELASTLIMLPEVLPECDVLVLVKPPVLPDAVVLPGSNVPMLPGVDVLLG
jgi:hypothetical protein